MLVECDGCLVRGSACGECTVSAVLEAPSGGGRPQGRVEFDDAEWRAVSALIDAGLLPRLRSASRGDPPPEIPGVGAGTVTAFITPIPSAGRRRSPHHRVRRVA